MLFGRTSAEQTLSSFNKRRWCIVSLISKAFNSLFIISVLNAHWSNEFQSRTLPLRERHVVPVSATAKCNSSCLQLNLAQYILFCAPLLNGRRKYYGFKKSRQKVGQHFFPLLFLSCNWISVQVELNFCFLPIKIRNKVKLDVVKCSISAWNKVQFCFINWLDSINLTTSNLSDKFWFYCGNKTYISCPEPFF